MFEEKFKKLWRGYGYAVDEGAAVENGHIVIVSTDGGSIFRFRTSFVSEDPYDSDTEKLITGGLSKVFTTLYGQDDFIISSSDVLPEYIPLDGVNKIYVAESSHDHSTAVTDKNLHLQGCAVRSWLIPVQAGAALTDVRIAKDCDNTGDNISSLNSLYSEATVMYWIWKNTSGQDRVGLFHYRRMFASDAACMAEFGEYDLVTTIPSFIPVTVRTLFTSTMVIDMDWQLMMAAIEQDFGEYHEDALIYEKSHLYFPCNIFFMKRELYDEMCTFIFGVTGDIREFYARCNVKRDERYLGYLVENLVSIFIMHKRWNIKKACVDMKYYPGIKDDEKNKSV